MFNTFLSKIVFRIKSLSITFVHWLAWKGYLQRPRENNALKSAILNFNNFCFAFDHVLEILNQYNCAKTLVDKEFIDQCAKNFKHKRFFLFNRFEKIPSKPWPWFSDRLGPCKKCNEFFNPKEFYCHSYTRWQSSLGQTNECAVDLRALWELSRLQFLVPLARSNDSLAKEFVVKTLFNWAEQNLYLCGPNWICPMEVALRSISIIYILYSLAKTNPSLINYFGPILLEHKQFIYDKLERFDRPNNHILCDLLGLVYLECFFGNIENGTKVAQELGKELEKQLQKDGALGEGSTAYHNLALELFVHLKALVEAFGLSNRTVDWSLLDKAITFAKETRGVKFGDCDSGKALCGIDFEGSNKSIKTKPEVFDFKDFGVLVYNDQHKQIFFKTGQNLGQLPSGHYHQNILGLNVQFDQDTILGNGTAPFYTKSKPIRDALRSIQAYSTFGCIHWIEMAKSWPDFWSNLAIKKHESSFILGKKNVLSSSFQSGLCHLKDNNCCSLGRVLKIEQNHKLSIDDSFNCQNKNCHPVWFFVTDLPTEKNAQGHLIKGKAANFLLKSTVSLFSTNLLSSSNYGAPTWTNVLTSISPKDTAHKLPKHSFKEYFELEQNF